LHAPVIETCPLNNPFMIFAGLKLLTGLTFLMMIGLKKNTTKAATEPLSNVFRMVFGGIIFLLVAIWVIEKPVDPLKKNHESHRMRPPITMCYIELY
jgi:p-aminobenzoyl-glutamate transporter AbgT